MADRQSYIILIGNFNDVIRESNNALTKLIDDFELIDVHTNKHEFDTDIPTCKRGPRQLEYMFVSIQLLDHT